MLAFLGEASQRHFDTVRQALDAVGQPYVINPRLVRGLDYYNLTVFEWTTPLLGAQATVCGGGRYDGLVEMVGGKPAPAVGWGMGIERVLDLLEQQRIAAPAVGPDAYAVIPTLEAMVPALMVAEQLRAAGVSVVCQPLGSEGPGSMKSQFKRADASGARYALVFGADELKQAMVSVKPLRDAQSAQWMRPLAAVDQWAHEMRNA
jgi:histidyl-tRNA synthetase